MPAPLFAAALSAMLALPVAASTGGDAPARLDVVAFPMASRAMQPDLQAVSPPADSSELHERARDLQDRFEALRRRALPRTTSRARWQECDEVVGRFCLFFGDEEEAEWEPVPDSPEILQARGDLLDSLSFIASRIPGDGWIVGQLVQYLGEEGRWTEALEWVDDCGRLEGRGRGDGDGGRDGGGDEDGREAADPDPDQAGSGPDEVVSTFARAQPGWWCHALRGYVLHRSDRYRESEAAFRRALARMHPDRRARWLNPDPLLDGDADDVWDDTGVEDRDRIRARLWTLADPLHLMDGNDRLTEHFARHTVAWIREDAENPYGISWGWDLEELAVRYGAEMGWNRTRTSAGSLRPANVVGHHHPESRHFLPPGRALEDPTDFEGLGWGGGFEADGSRGVEDGSTAYAPAYAPDFRFEPFQIARFRRGSEMIVVAGYRLPPPTAEPRSGAPEARARGPADPGADPPEAGPPEGQSPGGDANAPGLRRDLRRAAGVRAGFFLLDSTGGPVYSTTSPARDRSNPVEPGSERARAEPSPSGAPESGAFSLRVPAADYLASVEAWDSATARAGRSRRAVGLSPLPPDVAALSDLLILDPAPERAPEPAADPVPGRDRDLPETLEAAIPWVRAVAEACPGSTMVVGWELTGIGLRREVVEFALRLEPPPPGFFSRIGGLLGVTSSPEPVSLEWTEEGPEGLRPFFRAVRLSLPPEMEPGAHRLILEARLQGRNPLVAERRVEVRSPREAVACTGPAGRPEP